MIFVPQFPTKMRYQSWWLTELEKEFKKNFDEVITLGKNVLDFFEHQTEDGNFAPIDISIKFEYAQLQEFLDLKLEKNDMLFLSDLSFPGLFSNILYHKRIKNAYSFCHGTSKNSYDYFQDRDSKWFIESGHSKLFKKVFVATNYHKKKLGWKNTKVIGVPKPPLETFNSTIKENNIISVSRNNIQKINKRLEKNIEKEFGKITREEFDNWMDYYKFISKSKILLSTSKEETFGYQIMDSVINGCVPLAPNKFSYPELLPREYLYENENELINKINFYLSFKGTVDIPELLNQDLIDNFYNNLIKEMNF